MHLFYLADPFICDAYFLLLALNIFLSFFFRLFCARRIRMQNMYVLLRRDSLAGIAFFEGAKFQCVHTLKIFSHTGPNMYVNILHTCLIGYLALNKIKFFFEDALVQHFSRHVLTYISESTCIHVYAYVSMIFVGK